MYASILSVKYCILVIFAVTHSKPKCSDIAGKTLPTKTKYKFAKDLQNMNGHFSLYILRLCFATEFKKKKNVRLVVVL